MVSLSNHEVGNAKYATPSSFDALKMRATEGVGVAPSHAASPQDVPYSRASASTGSSRAAERAGMKPNTTPIRLADRIATTMDSLE